VFQFIVVKQFRLTLSAVWSKYLCQNCWPTAVGGCRVWHSRCYESWNCRKQRKPI